MSLSLHLGVTLALTLGGAPAPAATALVASDTVPQRWVLQAEASEALYRVREQLAGFDFPNDAVGSTRSVTGTLVLNPDGSIAPEESSFRIDLTTLVTDNDRRDNYVRQRTLEVGQYPEAVFVPRRFLELPSPLPTSGSVQFLIEGDLTLHGVTQTTRWEVMAQMGPDTIRGLATTAFPFERFQISVPQVARVLSVANNIRLELNFQMVLQGG